MGHKNPDGYWDYWGGYSVFLADGVNTDNLPPGATVSGRTVRVEDGMIAQSMGGINFYAKGVPLRWGYKYIKEIRDGRGNLLWQNYNYR